MPATNSAKEIERPACMIKLGLLPPYMPEDVEKAYLAKIKEIRPDLGGDPKPFYAVQNAYVEAKEYVKFRGDRRGWIAKQLDEYMGVQEVIDHLKKLGAAVETSSLDWLQKSFGDFAELTEAILAIRLHDAVNGDEFIEYLVSQRDKLLELRKLDLDGCGVTDGALRQLSVFRRLQELNLSRTPITWEALHVVQWLPELESVNIDGTGIGWLSRRKLARQLREKSKAAATLRAIHPTTVR